MKNLIGFAGRQGSGKDTCSDILVERHGYIKFAFADAVKLSCKNLFDLSDNQLWGTAKDIIDDRYGQSPRQLMQKLGTDFVRHMVRESFWIDKFAEWYADTDRDVVVSDVRFQDEVDMIRKLGGRVFMVLRLSNQKLDSHCSEQSELLNVDGLINNNGSLDDLPAKLDEEILYHF